jgi:DNA-binding CsgD family transcriptional regulator
VPVKRSKVFWPILILSLLLAVQMVSAAFFIFRLLADVFVWTSPIIPWELFELLEILASIGMVSGAVSSVLLLRFALRRVQHVEARLQAAAGQVQTYVEAQFVEWGLSKTECDVALLVVKGFSNAEIASYRGTTESTVKSQVSSIFRKSGLTSRQQLVSLVVEDLFEAITVETAT